MGRYDHFRRFGAGDQVVDGIVLGVLLNRINAFVVAFTPPYAETPYYPAVGELLVTAGAVSTIFFLYRVFVTVFPVVSAREQEV